MNPAAELIQRDDSLLLLVDIQKSMLNPCLESEQIVSRVSTLIDIVSILEIPIVFTEQNPVKLGRFVPELTRKVSEPLILDKLEFGCFDNPAIAAAIRATGRKTILLAGIETHICICQTGIQALQKGYRLHVAADATSCPRELNREIGLRRLERAGAVVSSTEMMIFELLHGAGTPEFRSALPILKQR